MDRGGGDNGLPITVVVAVKKAEGNGSRRAVGWATENLLPKANRLLLVHVMPIVSVPTPSRMLGDSGAEMFVNDTKANCEEFLLKLKLLCRSRKVETLILEGDNVALALLRFISDSRITSLVLGSGSSNSLMRKMKDLEVPTIVLKHAPDTCCVYVVSTNKLFSNSPNPQLNAGQDLDSHALSQQHNLSSSTKAKFDSCQSDITSFSHEQRKGFSGVDSGSTLDRDDISLEKKITDEQRNEKSTSTQSTCSEQHDIQTEVELLRVKLESNIAKYNRACEDLVHAQNRVKLLSSVCDKEAKRVHSARQREETLRIMAAKQKEKYLKAEREVEMAKKLLDKETIERKKAEKMVYKESLEKQKIVNALLSNDPRYRRYTTDELQIATNFFSENKMIGEGGFGRVYKCSLDHTLVAIKVLRQGATDKKDDFLREVEVLSQLRHPHIVLLLGACPENGSLVYEYMEGGSLDDHIFCRRGRSPLPLVSRFRIAFEIACGLAFLHSSEPEPIVHRDLKPGNILLDKYYVSKIGDVGLAKFIYEAVRDSITEYGDSIIAGTLNYIDPEYSRTGTLRPKSDLFAFGVITLQLLSSLPPKGIIPTFEKAVSNGSIFDILDKSVADWPLAETIELAEVALKCCSQRCRDRPDLETEVLPTLKGLVELVETNILSKRDRIKAPKHFYCPIRKEIMQDPYIAADGYTYEHVAIKAWVDRNDVSPVTKQTLLHKMLTQNYALLLAVQEWKKIAELAKVRA